jgi:hypothetical protein
MTPLNFAEIRAACAEVAARARYVHLDEDALGAYADALPIAQASRPSYDLAHHYLGTPAETVAYVLTLDAVNFGSGYFPHLLKRPGMSGYFTVASSLKDAFERHGPLSAEALAKLELHQCAALFGQDLTDPVRAELMARFTQALNDLGAFLLVNYGGSFTALVEAAGHSAARLGGELARMPFFRDVADYAGFKVPFYKRAQIAASDLALAFGGKDYGHFSDLDELTIFADNLVPHVLRVDGVLRYAADLAERIEAGELLAPSSGEEVELRAVALYAVERLVEILRRAGHAVTAQQLDVLLWNRGQDPRYKALKRHRTRTVYY